MRAEETNEVMLGLSKCKQSLVYLNPPESFSLTLSDLKAVTGSSEHSNRVKLWAKSTWEDWAEHHSYIHNWLSQQNS